MGPLELQRPWQQRLPPAPGPPTVYIFCPRENPTGHTCLFKPVPGSPVSSGSSCVYVCMCKCVCAYASVCLHIHAFKVFPELVELLSHSCAPPPPTLPLQLKVCSHLLPHPCHAHNLSLSSSFRGTWWRCYLRHSRGLLQGLNESPVPSQCIP